MKTDAIDKRFALISRDAEALYPFKKKQLSTGRYGFALSAPGDRDAFGGGNYTEDIADVIWQVVFNGWKVRATTVGEEGRQRTGSFKLGGKAIVGYWIDPDLRHLVADARLKPSALP